MSDVQSRPIDYLQRTRAYYGALGFPAYNWAEHADVPFTVPSKSLDESKLVLITTAAPYRPELGDQGPGAVYNAAAKFFEVYTAPIDPAPNLRISHLGYDRVHTTAEDPATWLPIAALATAQREHGIGVFADELIGIPTNRSQRITVEQDGVAALDHCLRLKADVALLVPS